MKVYNDGNLELRVVRCPADLYLIKGIDFLTYPTSNKDTAQAFVNSWAVKRQLPCHDDYDVDMSYQQPDFKLCKGCAKSLTGYCEVFNQYEKEKAQR